MFYLLKKLSVKVKPIKKLIDHFYNILVFNAAIRFMIEAYLELTLTTFINIHVNEWEELGDIAAGVLSYIFMVVLLAQIPILWLFIHKYGNRFTEKDFEQKYGSVYSDLVLFRSGGLAKYYVVIFCVRRIIISLVSVFL
jgi:hypothetical protein